MSGPHSVLRSSLRTAIVEKCYQQYRNSIRSKAEMRAGFTPPWGSEVRWHESRGSRARICLKVPFQVLRNSDGPTQKIQDSTQPDPLPSSQAPPCLVSTSKPYHPSIRYPLPTLLVPSSFSFLLHVFGGSWFGGRLGISHSAARGSVLRTVVVAGPSGVLGLISASACEER